jgi:glycosyltransferase domain-containing protein
MNVVTVVIPTYNRPAELRRLLTYFARSDNRLPVLVLDSSVDPARSANEEFCRRNPQVRYRSFDPAVVFYQKLQAGVAEMVETLCVCLCADDDIVIPQVLRKAAEAIVADASVGVAHGYYAHFKLGKSVRITNLGYIDGVADQVPFRRIAKGFLNYEATLYGVHKTSVMQSILTEAANAPNLFTAEILTTALTLGHGNCMRLAAFSHARSDAPSLTTRHWHPAELLAVDPAGLVEGIAFVRQRLIANFAPDRDALRLFDHAMLAYISDYMRPDATRRLARHALDGAGLETLRQAGWDEFAAILQPSPRMAALRRSAVVKWLKNGMARHLSIKQAAARLLTLRSAKDIKRRVDDPEGGVPGYVYLEPAFHKRLSSISMDPNDPAVADLADTMMLYNQAIPIDG